MILSFGNRETENLYVLGTSRKIHPHLRQMRIIFIWSIDGAREVELIDYH
jgi:plasmid maintenance system killer protein